MAKGSFLVSREAARVMIQQRMGGDIVYISSKNGVFAGPSNIAYGAAKADQAHQVRLLAAELGEFGIRVNGVNPDGVVRGSGIFAKGWGAQRAAVYGVAEEDLGAFYAKRTLLKREVLPEHVAAAVFVLDRRRPVADHGSALPVDAGVAARSFAESAGPRHVDIRGGRSRRNQWPCDQRRDRRRADHARPCSSIPDPDGRWTDRALFWDMDRLRSEVEIGLGRAAERAVCARRDRLVGRRLRAARQQFAAHRTCARVSIASHGRCDGGRRRSARKGRHRDHRHPVLPFNTSINCRFRRRHRPRWRHNR